MGQKQILLLTLLACYSFVNAIEPISIPLNRHSNNSTLNDNANLRKSTLLGDSGSITDYHINNVQNVLYTLDIQVGEKKELLRLLMDTGSNVMWIASTKCPNDGTFSKYYDCEVSDQCKATNPPKDDTIKYAQGSVSGSTYSVPISIGELQSIDQNFLLVTSVKDHPKADYSGLIGLGPKNEYNDGQLNWIQIYASKQLIPKPMFSVYLGFEKDQSELTLGGISDQYKDSTLSYHPLNKDKYIWWSVTCNKIQLGSIFETDPNFSVSVIFDSGFSYIGTDAPIWKQLFTAFNQKFQIQQNGNLITIKCSQVKDLPNLTISLPDQSGKMINYDLEPNFYIVRSNGLCALPFQSMSVGAGMAIGQVFLRKFIGVYSYDPEQVGLIRSVNAIPPMPTDSDDDGDDLPTYAKVLVGVGVLIAVAAIIYYGYTKYKQRKNQKKNLQQSTTSSIQQPLATN